MSEPIPVVWLTFHDNGMARGFWDQAMLDAVLSRDEWTPAGGYTYEHHHDKPPADGAVVVVPGRMNVEHVGKVIDALAALDWCLLVVTSDEESLFPWHEVTHPRMRRWVMTPRPDAGGADGWLGEGWNPQVRAALRSCSTEADARVVDWCFAGQITHPRRRRMALATKRIPNGIIRGSDSFAAGLPADSYASLLACAKVALAPSGPVTVDSFRAYEALEAGCLPVLDGVSPVWGNSEAYWPKVLGEVQLADLPVVTDWGALSRLMPQLLDGWPGNASRAFSAWQGYKRTLAYQLDSTVADLSGRVGSFGALADFVTVLMPTSPIPSHPSTGIIGETLDSLRDAGLGGCEVLIGVDGVRPEQEGRRAAFEHYTRRLLWSANHHWRNVLPVVFDRHRHQSGMTRALLDLVRTPLVLFVEHDTPIVGEVDWWGLIAAVRSGEANVVRLHHEASVLDPHRYLMLDRSPQTVHGVPMLRTAQWSQRPHLASAAYYRRLIAEHFDPAERWMIEDRMHGVLSSAWKDRGAAGWDEHRVWLYAPEGDGIKRSTHLDGRAGDPKWVDR